MDSAGVINTIFIADKSQFDKTVASVKKSYGDVEKTASATAGKLKMSSSQMSSAFESMSTRVGTALVGVGAALIGGTYGLKTFIDSASELQSLRASFESLTGTIDDTNSVMSTLYSYGKKTAFDNKSIQQTAKMFLANGVAIKDLMEWVTKLGDLAGATGADLTMLALPITQAIGRGKLQTQDWYQIINQGAGGLQKYIVAALGAGHSTKTFGDDLANGAVTTEIMQKALESASKSGEMMFEGALKQSLTFKGRMSNLGEAITQVGLKILGVDAVTGKVNPGGIFDKLSTAVSDATDWLTKNQSQIEKVAGIVIDNFIPALAALTAAFVASKIAAIGFSIAASANPISLIVMAIAALVAGLVYLQVRFNIFGKAIDWLKEKTKPLIDIWEKYLWPVLKKIGEFVGGALKSAWDNISDAFKRVQEALAPFQPQLEMLGKVMAVVGGIILITLVAPIAILVAGIVGIIVVIATLIGWIAQFVAKVAEIASSIQKSLQDGMKSFADFFKQVVENAKGMWNNITKIFTNVGTSIGNAISGAVRGVVNSVLTFVENQVNGFLKSINSATDIINKIPGVKVGKIGMLSIPKLATGGVVSSPTVAMIGEAGAEAIVPLENNTEWIAKLGSQLGEFVGGKGATIQQTNNNYSSYDIDVANRDLLRMARRATA